MTKQRKIPIVVIILSVAVLLVLAFVFLFTMPLMTTGASIDLPKQTETLEQTDGIYVSVTADRDAPILLQGNEVLLADLAGQLETLSGSDFTKRIYIRTSNEAYYGDVMKVMTRINSAGFSNVGLVTDPVKE